MKTVYILHIPSGETYPVKMPTTLWFSKPDVIDAIKLAQAEAAENTVVPWGDLIVNFTNRFDAYLFKCQPPTEIKNYLLNLPIVVLSDEFELINDINTEKMGVL